ncbi:hypothetical protein ACWGH8_26045 [Nonomuraea muscovyensis]|uniref:Uncharacterized protein n=1 Tax=Nonomuraea muscovyensis TaxID=1124761 RepID=A0A7X0C732_9ACTN|nr:hypothetical protein [Nonomuraea muscovyensis]MBB6347969.1 hypothetical protein [Nonomuraea muscovyensis]
MAYTKASVFGRAGEVDLDGLVQAQPMDDVAAGPGAFDLASGVHVVAVRVVAEGWKCPVAQVVVEADGEDKEREGPFRHPLGPVGQRWQFDAVGDGDLDLDD